MVWMCSVEMPIEIPHILHRAVFGKPAHYIGRTHMCTLSGLIGRVETNWVGTPKFCLGEIPRHPFAHGEIPCQRSVRYRASMGYKGKPLL